MYMYMKLLRSCCNNPQVYVVETMMKSGFTFYIFTTGVSCAQGATVNINFDLRCQYPMYAIPFPASRTLIFK